MKIIGLVGGTGWISTVEYYRIINVEINKRMGGLNFVKCIIYSLNYAEINSFNAENNKEGVYSLVLDASKKLISVEAEGIVLCANTLHQFAERLEKEIDVPIIHIASATAREIKKQNISRIGLLGTKQTMEMDFYKTKLNVEGIEVLVPDVNEREFINNSIFSELLKGIFKRETKEGFLNIIKSLNSQGAEGIVLGCTEIPLLIKEGDINLPLFNTLTIHSLAAVDFAME